MTAKQNILLLTLILLGGLFLAPITRAQTSEYPQITNQSCDATNRCPSGLECYSFPNIGLRCAQPDPCTYFKCPSDKSQCNYLESYPARLICRCEGSECPIQGGGEIPVSSYDVKTQQTTIYVITPDNQTVSRDISIKTAPGNVSISQGVMNTVNASVVADYSGKLVIENSRLLMETSAGKKQINILPEEALSKATVTTNVNAIKLKEESQQPIYSIKTTEQTKLFFVIPVSMQIETKVSAEFGNVISVKRPLWSFLTR